MQSLNPSPPQKERPFMHEPHAFDSRDTLSYSCLASLGILKCLDKYSHPGEHRDSSLAWKTSDSTYKSRVFCMERQKTPQMIKTIF